MHVNLPKLNTSVENFLRSCGYLQITDRHTQESSFVRTLYADRFYPRFHVYIEKKPSQTILNLHFDAKKPSYEGVAAHSGEYDGQLVEEESERINRVSLRFAPQPAPAGQKIGFKNKSLWEKIKALF